MLYRPFQDSPPLKQDPPTPMHAPTVTLRYAQALIQAAHRLGMDTPALPDGSERVPLTVQDSLWQQLCAQSKDPLIGIQLGQTLQVGHLDVAGMLLMSCETYGESLDALIEYLPIIGEGGEVSMQVGGSHVELGYTPVYDTCRAARVEAVFSAILHLSRWSTGGYFQAQALHLAHAPLDDARRYPGLLGCPVHFDAEDNFLRFHRDMLDLPLIQANSPLRDHLRMLADQALRQLDEESLATRVAELVRAQPRAGKERIAELLAISGRHLNRRLAEEGVSFKQLRDRELLYLAEMALRRDEKIAAIAETLGFSDESAFAKAFRRWTGMSPSQFRGH